MNDKQIKDVLKNTKTIASVGLSGNPDKPSFGIAEYLQSKGYRVIPVNPTAAEILGEKVYADLASIPEKVDVVQVFRPSADVPPVVDAAIQIGAKVVWMQVGVYNLAAAQAAEAAGLKVVMDRCMRQEHIRLMSSPLAFLGL
jgi:predicted CoA-binding protein